MRCLSRTMTRSHSSSSRSVHTISCTPSSVRASIRSMSENGNRTLVSTKTRAIGPPSDGSVREVRFVDRIGDATTPLLATAPAFGEGQHVIEPDDSMTATRQVRARDRPVVQQSSDERP